MYSALQLVRETCSLLCKIKAFNGHLYTTIPPEMEVYLLPSAFS